MVYVNSPQKHHYYSLQVQFYLIPTTPAVAKGTRKKN